MPTPTTASTAHQVLATELLGVPVLEWIDERRSQGRSWRLVARDLLAATDGKVDVTPETVRLWTIAPAPTEQAS
jgi:hypothetical protein